MASHLSDIGFGVKDEAEFIEFAQKVYENGKRIESNKGAYILWSLKSGSELWVQLNEKEEIIGMNPGFLGGSSRKVSLINSLIGHEGTLDKSFEAWANPVNDDPESGDYPFMFDIPNYHTLPKFKYPKIANIQLTAFAHELTCFDNEKEFNQNDKSYLGGSREGSFGMQYAAESFIPKGSFHSEGATPTAEAIFVGKVIKYSVRVNDFTKKPFSWFLVKTLGGNIDVVTDPSLLNKEPVKGGYLMGSFWLSGKILNP